MVGTSGDLHATVQHGGQDRDLHGDQPQQRTSLVLRRPQRLGHTRRLLHEQRNERHAGDLATAWNTGRLYCAADADDHYEWSYDGDGAYDHSGIFEDDLAECVPGGSGCKRALARGALLIAGM